MGFGPEVTKTHGQQMRNWNGITVKSKAEAKIANYFQERGIEFEYEPLVRAGGMLETGKRLPDQTSTFRSTTSMLNIGG